jgi:GNAT superfamily N-acetyltransferase
MPTADGPEGTLLTDQRGVALATFRWRDEDGERVVGRLRPNPGVSADRAARQAVRDLAGCRLTTPEEDVARALIGAGCTLLRAATDLQRDLREPIPRTPPAAGWALIPHDWDDDLAEALTAAYGPDHPDRGDRVDRLRGLLDSDRGLVLLAGASARLRGPDGRSAGQVFTVGPVPWGSTPMSWVLDLAVAPVAQGRGLGAALLAYAMRGTLDAGLTTVGLTVTDGNPARRLYDRMGFRPTQRHFAVRTPATPLSRTPTGPNGE